MKSREKSLAIAHNDAMQLSAVSVSTYLYLYLFHVSFTYRGEQAARLTHGAQIAQQAQEEHDGPNDEQSVGQLLNDLWLCKVLQERERERDRVVSAGM